VRQEVSPPNEGKRKKLQCFEAFSELKIELEFIAFNNNGQNNTQS
jgi:hypothetical protein